MHLERYALLSIPVLWVLISLLGFLFAFPSLEQVALFRLILDCAAALLSSYILYLFFPKKEELKTGELISGLRELAKGNYDKRLEVEQFGPLEGTARAFNELAGTLSDSRLPAQSFFRYKEIPQKPSLINELHSHHPELGPVVLKPAKTEPLEEGLSEAELQALYEEFSAAHRKLNQMVVDFGLFKDTIHKTQDELKLHHACKTVKFEVVTDSGEVALQPKLVR